MLTSSYAHNLSTGNWTFTDSVLAGLRGEVLVDLDGDEMVDLPEIARYAELQLAFTAGDQLQVHYVGFGESWDEWVGPGSIRLQTESLSDRCLAFAGGLTGREIR